MSAVIDLELNREKKSTHVPGIQVVRWIVVTDFLQSDVPMSYNRLCSSGSWKGRPCKVGDVVSTLLLFALNDSWDFEFYSLLLSVDPRILQAVRERKKKIQVSIC